MKIIGYVVGEMEDGMPVCLPCSKGYRKGYELHGLFDDQWVDAICEICEGEIK